MGIQAEGSATLADYLRVVRRRWWLVLLVAVVVPAAAYYFSSQQQKLYTASTKMLVSNQPLPSTLSGVASKAADPTRDLSTLASVAEVPTVADRALAAVPGNGLTPGQLLGETSVSADPNADILTFSVTDKRPGVAVRLANAYAAEFIKYRIQLQTTVIDNALATLGTRIHKLKASLQGVKPADQDPTVRQQLGVLLSKQQDLQNLKALQGNNLVVVDKASSAPQTQPKTARNVALGLVLGLVLGLGLAFLANALDSRVRDADEVARGLAMALLARIPAPPRGLSKKHELAMLAEQPGAHGEAYRKLRTNFDFANLTAGARTVLITSSVEKEGKSTTIANLAVAMARAGRRVVLVDLDLRRPMLARFFDLGERRGITDVALGRVPLDDAMVAVPIGDGAEPLGHMNGNGSGTASHSLSGSLRVMPAGSIPPDPAEFVGSQTLADLLARLHDEADIVLIDSPPLLPVSDAMTLCSVVDGVIVVARAGDVTRNMLGEVHRLLSTVPATKLGFVLTNSQVDSRYGYGGYYGGYTPTAQAPAPEPARESIR